MTPAVLEKTGVAGAGAGFQSEGSEMLQRAFQQGAEYAASQIVQQQAEQAAIAQQQQLEALQKANDEQ